MYFTICIPVFNRKNTIIRTLTSIASQEFDSYEVLIVDDGSNDGTKEVVGTFLKNMNNDKFIYIYKENGGKHSALNVGFQKAKGLFFMILDSDDWLVPGALLRMKKCCTEIENNDNFCGIMGKTRNSKTGLMMDDKFDLTNPVSSYFDYHFILPQKMYVQDCYEAIKTSIVKQYSFPEQPNMKFVPEAYVLDKIGVKYSLLLTNEIFRETEYLEDGMTMDKDFKKKNVAGFLYHYISRIENVIPKKKMSPKLKIKLLILSWWRYWQCVKLDKKKIGPRIEHVTIIGYCVRCVTPTINWIFKLKYPQYLR